MGKQTQRILGIDPGTRLCGWGFVDCDGSQITHVDNGVVVLSAKDELYSRLGNLLEQLNALIEKYQPTSVAVEGVFQHRNARSALILGHARGVALAIAAKHGLAVHEYAARQVKKALTGTGTAQRASPSDGGHAYGSSGYTTRGRCRCHRCRSLPLNI